MMSFLRRILVPLDGSNDGDMALEAIRPLLRKHSPEVLLLGVMEPEGFDHVLKDHLEYQADRLRAVGVNAVPVLGRGKAAPEILEFTRRENADLIAMGTKGRTGLERIFAGSVAEDVVRHTEVPVLVTRKGAPIGEWKRIMVLFDGSPGAEEILPDAAVIAKEAETTLDLVRVSVPIVAATGMGEVPIVVPGDDPRPYLGDVVARLAQEGIPSRAVALEGRPAAEILEYAKANKVGLILMTTHGRAGVRRALVGSVAEEILRHAPCPVLLRRLVPVSEPARKVEHA